MKTKPLLNGTTGPGSVAGRTTITRIDLLLPLLLLLVLPGLAEAQFNYTVDGGTVTITKYTGPGGEVVIPETIDGMLVAGIGSYAFSDRADVTGVVIPESVTSIGESAFGYCTGLTNITIPNSVTSIGFMSWYGCSGLSSVAIPSSVTSMSGWAFGECSNLTSISVDAQNPNYSSLDGVLFNKNQSTLMRCPGGKIGSYAIPASVTRIEHFAFDLCAGLTGVEIPNSVDTIPEFAFAGCSGLTDVTLPDSVTSIGENAFGECTSLTSITIPDNVTTIGWVAFMGCTGLTSVTIGNGVIKIGYAAFYLCSGLTSLTIPKSVKNIESWAFNGCTSLAAVYFEGDAPMLDYYTFYGTSATIYYFLGTSGWGPTFGGRPTVAVVPDRDGDGVPDAEDCCPFSDMSATVIVGGRDSGVTNAWFPGGCTISDHIAIIAGSARNHGKFVNGVAEYLNELKKAGVISGAEKGAIQNCAARAAIP